MLTLRELPPADWPRLTGTELAGVLPLLDPAQTRIAVVEDADGLIVGCWSLTAFVHAEGIWIHPGYRNAGGVARRLLRWFRDATRGLGVRAVLTGAVDPEVAAYIARLGGRPLPGQAFVLPVRE